MAWRGASAAGNTGAGAGAAGSAGAAGGAGPRGASVAAISLAMPLPQWRAVILSVVRELMRGAYTCGAAQS